MQQYYCFGCSPDQHLYIENLDTAVSTGSGGVIRVCESFANQLWKQPDQEVNLQSPTTRFDGCGMYNKACTDSSCTAQQQILLPSRQFSTAEEFLNANKPPFFEGFTIKIVADPEDNDDASQACYKNAEFLRFFLGFTQFLMVFLFKF